MVTITDDLLTAEDFAVVCEMTKPDFPWYSNDHTDFEGDENPQFTHMFYHNIMYQQSDWLHVVWPLLRHINPFALLKVKGNLNTATSKESQFHIDYQSVEDKVYPELKELIKTSIFYLDDDLGATEFENGDMIPTKANRLITFPSGMRHRSVKHTQEGKRRFVVNMNYIPFKNG